MRILKWLLIVFVVLVALGWAGSWAVKKGQSPLVDGAQLQNGKVTVVVDGTSPMPVVAYLLQFKNGSLGLIDAGMDPEAKAVLAALRRMNRAERDVKVILFTHSHGDHTGGARRFPEAELYAMNPPGHMGTDQSTWNRVQRALPGEQQLSGSHPKAIRLLHDGEVLEVNGDRIEAFGVPGHTYDSSAYLAFGVLFLGDSAAGQYNGRIGSAPPFVSVDRKMNQRSLKRLAEKVRDRTGEVQYLAFGHQGPIQGLDPLLSWASSH